MLSARRGRSGRALPVGLAMAFVFLTAACTSQSGVGPTKASDELFVAPDATVTMRLDPDWVDGSTLLALDEWGVPVPAGGTLLAIYYAGDPDAQTAEPVSIYLTEILGHFSGAEATAILSTYAEAATGLSPGLNVGELSAVRTPSGLAGEVVSLDSKQDAYYGAKIAALRTNSGILIVHANQYGRPVDPADFEAILARIRMAD